MSNEIAATPAQEGTAAPAVETPTVSEEVTSGAPPQEGTSATPDSEAQRLKRSQETRERIEELTARAKAALEYGEFYRQRFEESQRQSTPSTAAPVQEQPDPEPNEEDFDDPKAYVKAHSAWVLKEADKRIERATKSATENAQKAAQEAMKKAAEESRLKTMGETFESRQQQFAAKTPDYWDTVRNPALSFFNGQFLEVLMEHEKGPEIAYHIAKSPKEAARLAGQSISQRLASIGRIEAELSRPAPPPKVTAAPAPPSLIGGGPSTEPDPSKLSTDDWMNWRTRQIREKRTAR